MEKLFVSSDLDDLVEKLPTELSEKYDELLESLDDVGDSMQLVLDASSPNKQVNDTTTTLIEEVRHRLVSYYAINSIFWVYLQVNGSSPREHAIKGELDRVKRYMNLFREAEFWGKKNPIVLDKEAANRFVKHSLGKMREIERKMTDGLKERDEFQDEPANSACTGINDAAHYVPSSDSMSSAGEQDDMSRVDQVLHSMGIKTDMQTENAGFSGKTGGGILRGDSLPGTSDCALPVTDEVPIGQRIVKEAAFKRDLESVDRISSGKVSKAKRLKQRFEALRKKVNKKQTLKDMMLS